MYTVYLHINKTNNKKYYGITSTSIKQRWRNGSGYAHNLHFSSAIKKYGWDGFKHVIIKENLSQQEAELLESKLIQENFTNNENFGYNLTSGGGLGVFRHSKESKEKMSIHKKGELNPMYGKSHNIETREKISSALKNHSKMSKTVLCVETEIIYPSTREAERQLGISHVGINAVCNGKQKTSGGYHWKYINEGEI